MPSIKIKSYAGLFLVIGLFLGWYPLALAQEGSAGVQDLVINGGFEGGFQQEFGVGYGWGAFSNGNAVVAWGQEKSTAAGQYAQRMEIKDALENDRYMGIYQTISVVPGQQYKLSLQGQILSDEGQVSASDYGYRLQYAVDYNGDTAWELVPAESWQELPWDEQSLDFSGPLDSFNTTLTAQTNEITIFIRGWKKWTNNGTGVFVLDNLQVIGPAPAGFQAPVSQPESPAAAPVEAASEKTVKEAAAAMAANPGEPPAVTEPTNITTLPVTGYGDDEGIFFLVMLAVTLLVVLFGGAFAATFRWRNL